MKNYIQEAFPGKMIHDQLRHAVEEARDAITKAKLKELIDRMHDRCRAVIDAEDPSIATENPVLTLLDEDPTETVTDADASPTDGDREDFTLESSFNEAGNDALNLPNGYPNVSVLLISWIKELDHLMVDDEVSKCPVWEITRENANGSQVNQLEALLRDTFGFETKRLLLHTEKDPQLQLNMDMSGFVYEHGGPGNLLIVYYGGHGSSNDNKELFLSGRTRQDNKIGNYKDHVCWNKAEASSLMECQADILAIFDCCYASDIQRAVNSCPRSYEILAASGPRKTTPKHAFTPKLIEALKEMVKQRKDGHRISFNTRQLWQTICNKRPEDEQPVLWDRLGSSRFINISPVDKLEIPKTPLPDLSDTMDLTLHFTLTSKPTEDQVKKLARRLPKPFTKAGMRVCRFRWGNLRRFNWGRSTSLSRVVSPILFASRIARKFKGIRERKSIAEI
ncbi:hypothetical protein FGG08_006474 [Glutinoglossum americanum]|uniref:Uncharacterized protein n=1 Tax=Glutinoglossum americanum TaxID=1670608 RepID=A0A9P8I7B0_9PEZI|nr:hypothetical protein FGG08_006474 [Glutinoglossum americanum]